MYLSSYLNNMEGSSNLNNLNISNGFVDFGNNTYDENLILNSVRSRKKNSENPCCPVCSCTIRNNELENHFSLEVERLNKISGNIGTKRKFSNGTSNNLNMMSIAGSSSGSQIEVAEEGDVDVTGSVGSEVFQRVRQNRQRRLRTRVRSRLTSTSDSTGECPVCGRRLPRRRLQRHALRCLRKTGGALPGDEDDELLDTSSSEEGSIDVEGDDPMEAAEQSGGGFGTEYQWCGQWRVRAAALQARESPQIHTSSLRRASNDTTLHDLQELSNSGISDCITRQRALMEYPAQSDRDITKVVDGDEDTELYGPPQYSPSQINPDQFEQTPSTSQEQLQNSYNSHSKVNDRGTESVQGENDVELEVHGETSEGSRDDEGGLGKASSTEVNEGGSRPSGGEFGLNLSLKSASCGLEIKGRGTHVAAAQVRISALMARVRELEERQETGNEVKCLICLGPYIYPAVSIQCWHVHCESCWMDALRAKKICPQCNAITTTQHLRRVYM